MNFEPRSSRLLIWTCCSLVLAALLVGRGAQVEAPTSTPPATQARMKALLDQIAAGINPMNNRFDNAARAELLKGRLEKAASLEGSRTIRLDYSRELLNAGRSEEALREFNASEEEFRKAGKEMVRSDKALLRQLQALACLRMGEQMNCLSNHNADSCIFPIQGGGIHKNTLGSSQAITILQQTLGEFPEDLGSRWLLNIAYMTLGGYPERVPSQWLIPPTLFQSNYDIKRFTDVAPGLGLALNELSGGGITEDFDGDGYLDIMTSSLGFKDQMRLFHNNANGTFTDVTVKAGLTGETGGLNMIQGDYNNDGHIDVLVLRGGWMEEAGRFPKSLLRNNGNGTFTDVTFEAGVLSLHPTQTAVWFDFDNDGWLDLFIGHESRAKGNHPSELYRNNGNETFTECAAANGIIVNAFVKGVTAGDFNNDGRPDLYISVRGRPNILFRNDGPQAVSEGSKSNWKFTDVALAAGVRLPINSFPCWFFDYDNDGWQDLFVSGYQITGVGDVAADYMGLPHKAERARLYRNNRDGTFRDVTRELGLYKLLHAMGSNFGDLDNDGFLDFYLGTGDPDLATLIPNRMFRNASGTNFVEVTYSGGFGNLQKGHAVAFADLDNDGDQDVYIDMGGAFSGDVYPNVLYENPGHGNHWLTLKLEGTKANRAAIGARIAVTVATPEGDRVIRKSVGSGGSFGASPLRQEIGMGNATSIKSVEVAWPSSSPKQVFTGLELDRIFHLTEGNPMARVVHLKTLRFQQSHPAHHH